MPRRILVLLGALMALGLPACSTSDQDQVTPSSIVSPNPIADYSIYVPKCHCTIHNPDIQLTYIETATGMMLDFTPRVEDPEVWVNLVIWLRKAVPQMIPKPGTTGSPAAGLATLGHRISDGGGDRGGGDPVHPHAVLRLNEFPPALIHAVTTNRGSCLVIDAANPADYEELLLGVTTSVANMVCEACIM